MAWHNPEFRDTKKITLGPTRIHSGLNSIKYFTFWSVHQAGLMQTVAVPAGSTVRFGVWMHAWSSNQDGRGRVSRFLFVVRAEQHAHEGGDRSVRR